MSYSAETPRLWLEPLTVSSHLEDFLELWNDPKPLKYLNVLPKTTLQEAEEFMHTILPNPSNPDINKYAILLRPVPENEEPWVNKRGKPKMIGLTGTNRWSEQGLETGYILNIRYWGQGYAGEAFRCFLGLYWGLEERKDIKKLVAKCDPRNVASQKVLVRVGAKSKGEMIKYEGGVEGRVREIECWYLERPYEGDDGVAELYQEGVEKEK